MRLRCSSSLLIAACGLAACSSATSSKCESLTKKLVERVKTECSINKPGCGGNPTLDRPVTPFTKFHNEELEALLSRDCPTPSLGSAPWLCNNGSPECPEGYQCCAVGGEDQCRNDCRDGGVGPDVGPRPDGGAVGDATAPAEGG